MIYVVARRGPGTVNLVDVQINLTKAILIYIYIYIYRQVIVLKAPLIPPTRLQGPFFEKYGLLRDCVPDSHAMTRSA